MLPILKILIFSAVAIAYLFIMSKLLGKKQIAQLDVIDYMLGIAVSSVAAELAIDAADKPIHYYLTSMTFFFLINLLIVFLERKGAFWKSFLKGKPQMIIFEGKIDYKALKKSKMDVNDLIAKSREKGYFDLNDIAYAVFENSGELSVMPKGGQRPIVAADLDIPLKQAELPYYLIDDGHIRDATLRALDKDTSWLYQRLKTDKKGLDNIILAVYDKENDNIIVHSKY